MTDVEIGVEIGAPQSIVTRLRNGKHKSTSFDRGNRIFSLLQRKRSSNDVAHRLPQEAA